MPKMISGIQTDVRLQLSCIPRAEGNPLRTSFLEQHGSTLNTLVRGSRVAFDDKCDVRIAIKRCRGLRYDRSFIKRGGSVSKKERAL